MKIDKDIGYSQNFLKSKKLINMLIEKSSIGKRDLVVEIGAGEGIITEQLSKYSKKVIGIEIDPSLYTVLVKKFQKSENVEILNNNFLFFNLPKSIYKVFSNIPFNYTSRILKRLYLESKNPPQSSYISIQKEAYYKYSGEYKESQISLLLKPNYKFNIIYKFNKKDFEPQPSVDVYWIEITKREISLVSNYSIYRDFIVYGTTQWNKGIKNCLKKVFTYKQMKIASKEFGFSITDNPLELNFNQWQGLYSIYIKYVPDFKKTIVKNSYIRQKATQDTLDKIHRSF